MGKRKASLLVISICMVVSICYSARHHIAAVVVRIATQISDQMRVEEIQKKPRTQDEMIKAVVAKHLSEIMDCYNERLKEGLDKNGDLKVTWDLDENGNTSNFEEAVNELGDAELFQCSSRSIATWKFPRGIPFKVRYTFHLKQKDKRSAASERPPIEEEEDYSVK